MHNACTRRRGGHDASPATMLLMVFRASPVRRCASDTLTPAATAVRTAGRSRIGRMSHSATFRSVGLSRTAPLCPGRSYTGLNRLTLLVLPGGERLGTPRPATGPDVATRRLVLARDGHACACCGRSIAGQPYRILQRQSRRAGGDYSAPNLLTILGTLKTGCLGRIESRADSRDRTNGYVLGPDEDPAKVAVRLHASRGVVWLAADGTCRHTEPET